METEEKNMLNEAIRMAIMATQVQWHTVNIVEDLLESTLVAGSPAWLNNRKRITDVIAELASEHGTPVVSDCLDKVLAMLSAPEEQDGAEVWYAPKFRYEVRVIGVSKLGQLLLPTNDAAAAKAWATAHAPDWHYGTAVLDTETGLVDFGDRVCTIAEAFPKETS